MQSSRSTILTPAPPRECWIQLPEILVHYLEWGDLNRPTLVLLRGGGQTAYAWQRVAERFASRYHIVTPDARGRGDSGWASDGHYGLGDFREDLRQFVGTLGLDRFVLAGMSLGGITAFAYAGDYGSTLRGLMIVDVAPEVERAGRDRILAFMQGRDSFESLEDAVAYAHAFNPRRAPETLRQTLPANLRTLPDGRLQWKWDPAFIRDASRTEARMLRPELWDAAARIPCPTLVIHGAESGILSRDIGARLAATIPQGRLVSIAGAGHSVQGDNPHNLGEALEQFLDQLGY